MFQISTGAMITMIAMLSVHRKAHLPSTVSRYSSDKLTCCRHTALHIAPVMSPADYPGYYLHLISRAVIRDYGCVYCVMCIVRECVPSKTCPHALVCCYREGGIIGDKHPNMLTYWSYQELKDVLDCGNNKRDMVSSSYLLVYGSDD